MKNTNKLLPRTKEDIIRKNIAHIDQANFLVRSVNNPIRQRIISMLLSCGQYSVTALCSDMEIEQSVMSQHLAILRRVKLVTSLRSGKYQFYSVNETQLNKVMAFIKQITPLEEIQEI